MPAEHEKRRLVQWLRAEMAGATGRSYPRLRLDVLDLGSLRELQRLLRDLEGERDDAVRRARMMPWRMP